MRMMNLPDYVSNMHTTAQMAMQPVVNAMSAMMPSQASATPSPSSSSPSMASSSTASAAPASYGAPGLWHSHPHHHEHGCGCHEEDCGCHDHGCHCHICCADLVEYARCSEIRQIPITFENETRRERAVKLELGAFLDESGQQLPWKTKLSDTEFTLRPCGEKTITLTVAVVCPSSTTSTPPGTTSTPNPTTGTTSTPNQPTGAQSAANQAEGTNFTSVLATATNADQAQGGSVDRCKVGYVTLRADGCTIRPLVIAIGVLPNHCGSHHAECGCGCCCD
jgi:hypothetical protein